MSSSTTEFGRFLGVEHTCSRQEKNDWKTPLKYMTLIHTPKLRDMWHINLYISKDVYIHFYFRGPLRTKRVHVCDWLFFSHEAFFNLNNTYEMQLFSLQFLLSITQKQIGNYSCHDSGIVFDKWLSEKITRYSRKSQNDWSRYHLFNPLSNIWNVTLLRVNHNGKITSFKCTYMNFFSH